MARTSAKVHPTWRKALSLSCVWEEERSGMNKCIQPAKKFLIHIFYAGVSSLCTKPPKAFRGRLVLSPIHTLPFSNLYSTSCTFFSLLPLSVYLTHRMISKIVKLSFVVQRASPCCCKMQIAIYLQGSWFLLNMSFLLFVFPVDMLGFL